VLWFNYITIQREKGEKMRPFSFSVIEIGDTAKPLTTLPFQKVSRFTIKVRSMGSNTVIDLGDRNTQEFRLTAVGDSFTFVDIPGGFDLQSLWIGGDNVANDGIVEVMGLMLE
jgi:hypothetical protein